MPKRENSSGGGCVNIFKGQNLKMLMSPNGKGQIHPALIRLDFRWLGGLVEVVGMFTKI